MALRKHKLELAIDEDYCLLGMVSDDPDYKVCWQINRALGTDFRKKDDLELYHRKLDLMQEFSLFSYEEPESFLTYRIISNRSDPGHFLDELMNLDYLIHIQGEIFTDKIQVFMQNVAAIPEIRMCVPVDLSRIRNHERLLLW
jgi:hypothetical protein